MTKPTYYRVNLDLSEEPVFEVTCSQLLVTGSGESLEAMEVTMEDMHNETIRDMQTELVELEIAFRSVRRGHSSTLNSLATEIISKEKLEKEIEKIKTSCHEEHLTEMCEFEREREEIEQELEEKIEKLKEELKELQEEKEGTDDEFDEITERVDELEREMLDMSDEKSNLEEQVEESHEQLKSHFAKLTASQDMSERLNDRLVVQEGHLRDAKFEISRYQINTNLNKPRIQELEAMVVALNVAANHQSDELVTAGQRIEFSDTARWDAEESVRTLRKDVKMMTDSNVKQADLVKELRRQITSLENCADNAIQILTDER